MNSFHAFALGAYLATIGGVRADSACPEINTSIWRQNIHTYVTQMESLQRKKPGYPARLNTYDPCRPITEGLTCDRNRLYKKTATKMMGINHYRVPKRNLTYLTFCWSAPKYHR